MTGVQDIDPRRIHAHPGEPRRIERFDVVRVGAAAREIAREEHPERAVVEQPDDASSVLPVAVLGEDRADQRLVPIARDRAVRGDEVERGARSEREVFAVETGARDGGVRPRPGRRIARGRGRIAVASAARNAFSESSYCPSDMRS